MSVDRKSCGRLFQTTGSISRETAVSVSCPRAWDNELTSVRRSQMTTPPQDDVGMQYCDIRLHGLGTAQQSCFSFLNYLLVKYMYLHTYTIYAHCHIEFRKLMTIAQNSLF